MLQELLQLLRLAAEAVPNPHLTGTTFQAEYVVSSSHAVKNERTAQAFAQRYLSLESFKLQGIRSLANLVEPTFSYESAINCQRRLQLRQALGPVGSQVPRVKPEGSYRLFAFRQQTMCVEIQILHR